MKKVLLSAAALIAAAAALPAAAQTYGAPYGQQQRGYYDNRGWSPVETRLQRLDSRIDRGIERGLLTRREAQQLRYEFRQLVQLERQWGRDGLSYRERAELERRLDILSQRVRWERRDDDRRDRWYDDRRY